MTAALHAAHPDMGENVAIDGSDMPAYANGQRYVSKNGPERERFSDPDASWGHRSAVSTREGGGFYGYRLHAAVCAVRVALHADLTMLARLSQALARGDQFRSRRSCSFGTTDPPKSSAGWSSSHKTCDRPPSER